MDRNFFPNRAFFWAFWVAIIFIFGMIGYLIMDTFDYMNISFFNTFVTDMIYVLLASLFVICATLQFFAIYYMNKDVERYYTMIISCLFDKVGAHAYLFGAILTVVDSTKVDTIWTLSTIGVCGFVIGAAINLMIPSTSYLYIWADYFNLLGSLLYLLATIITRLQISQLIVIFGDTIYLIDSILYMLCWFQDRRLVIEQNGQYMLMK
ncbi:unnamed protein product [Adineta steineri]|uniref:Uncharacterized protein n=1 Tax=Adineta steineri TaxID=433720 RepID=A0A818S075_9BILA|nr:unnamed protein product [Adineta steineri]